MGFGLLQCFSFKYLSHDYRFALCMTRECQIFWCDMQISRTSVSHSSEVKKKPAGKFFNKRSKK